MKVVSKRPKYLAKAAEHSHLAETCQSEEAREIHRDLAEWFLLLADDRWFDDVRPEFESFDRPSKQEETANHEKWNNDPTEQYHVD